MPLITAGVVLVLSGPAGPAERPDIAYAELVARYARGERAAAVAGLGRWKAGDLEREAARAAASTGFPLRPAAMLHADRDDEERPESPGREQPRACTTRQTAIVRRYAEALALREDGRDFGRRLFLVMGQRGQWDACFDAAIAWAEAGLRWFPRDRGLLLLLGSVHEEAATLATFGAAPWSSGEPPSGRQRALEEDVVRNSSFLLARRALEKAAAEDPEPALARVRLGRVHWRLGDLHAARAQLERAVEGGGDPAILYLAHLFLGRVHEDGQRLDAAAAAYERALGLDPHAQAAAIALSQVRQLQGDAAGARAVLARALSKAGRRPARDAYWDYLAFNARGWRDALTLLREEALR